jgi:RHS repeat-associated protein
MPKRNGNTDAYRYGFNGKEKDNEVYNADGTEYDYGRRIYNPRLAKFMSVDPLTMRYPQLSPYQFADNTPIQAIDVDGLEKFKINDGTREEFNQITGQIEIVQGKRLFLLDASAKFQVIDEKGVSLANFKYCSFQCALEGLRTEMQPGGAEGARRLVIPKGGDLGDTPSTFEMFAPNTDPKVTFKADQRLGYDFGTNVVSDKDGLTDRISQGVQKQAEALRPAGSKSFDIKSEIDKNNVVRIQNGTSLSQNDIVSALKEANALPKGAKIEYSEVSGSQKGSLNIQLGKNECKECE